MNFTALLIAASLGAAPSLSDERPLWAGSFQPTSEVVLVANVPGGLGVRSATATVLIGVAATNALGAGLCTGAEPRLAIPAGQTVHLLGPGAPASLVASVSLPAQAVSGAMPVTTPSGCKLAVVLQNGDVALVGASGGLTTLSQVLPVIADWHELPRGVLIASRQDLLVVGGVDGSLAAIQMADGKRFAGSIPAAAVPGTVWSDGQAALWFLGKTGSLFAWKVTTDAPQLVVAGTAASPGGLVAWGGKTDRGIAWADMQGDVRSWKGGTLRKLVRLPAAVRWPMLVADLDDTGDLKLVAPVDGTVVALVTEVTAGGSFQLLPVAGRPSGSPVAFQMSADTAPVLAIPVGPTQGSFQAADGVPAGQLVHDQAILNSGAQFRAFVPGTVTALLDPPASTGGGTGTGGGETAASSGKSGFGCSTAPAADALGLLLAPLLLLRRRRRTAV
jgi:hypothetical protein